LALKLVTTRARERSVSGVDLTLSAQAYFRNIRYSLHSRSVASRSTLKRIVECALTAPLPLTRFSARFVPFRSILRSALLRSRRGFGKF